MDLKDQFIGMITEQKQKQEIQMITVFTRFLVDPSFQGIRRFFVLAFDNTDGGDKKS